MSYPDTRTTGSVPWRNLYKCVPLPRVCTVAEWREPERGGAPRHGGQTAAADHLPTTRARRQGAAPQVPQAAGAAPPAACRREREGAAPEGEGGHAGGQARPATRAQGTSQRAAGRKL